MWQGVHVEWQYYRIFLEKFTWYRIKFPVERNAFVRVIQRSRHDVTWKPAIWPLINKNTFKGSPPIYQYDQLILFHSCSHIFSWRCVGTKSHNISQNVASPMLSMLIKHVTWPFLRVPVKDINRFAYVETPPKSSRNDINRVCLHRVITKINYFNIASVPI